MDRRASLSNLDNRITKLCTTNGVPSRRSDTPRSRARKYGKIGSICGRRSVEYPVKIEPGGFRAETALLIMILPIYIWGCGSW